MRTGVEDIQVNCGESLREHASAVGVLSHHLAAWVAKVVAAVRRPDGGVQCRLDLGIECVVRAAFDLDCLNRFSAHRVE